MPTAEPEPEAVPLSPVAEQVAAFENVDPAAHVQAARELARMGPAAREAVPTLVRALEVGEPAVAVEAARALGEIRDRSAVRPLLSALARTSSENPTALGQASVRSLARLAGRGNTAVAEGLLQAARGSADPAVRASAATALPTVAAGSSATAATLAGIADADADESVRKAAAAAADQLDPGARRRLAAAGWTQKAQDAVQAGRLVEPADDCALAHALKALELDPQSRDARRLHEQTFSALQSEVRQVAKSDIPGAERLVELAAALEPGRPELGAMRSAIAEAKQEEYRRTHVFRLVHKHSSKSALGGVISIGDGRTTGCRGVLELLEDGFRFDTEHSEDSRQDHVELRRAQIKKVQIRQDGEQLHVETTNKGNWDFYGKTSDIQRIQQALAR
jgi:HEAT repeat protein